MPAFSVRCARALLTIATLTVLVPAALAHAAAPMTPQTPSGEAMQFGKAAGAACPGAWDSQPCLSVISKTVFVMASNYGATLKQKGLEADAEQVKQHCAAATAAQDHAYAMKSAFIECANLITDTSEKTNVQPDLSEFQLLGAAAMCLGNDPRCGGISDQLKALAAK